jgi:cytochrome c-type biogenesis protein
MPSGLAAWALSFVTGLLTPLGSVCVLPLYPGYLAFLAGTHGSKGDRFSPLFLGSMVAAGAVSGMLLFGLLVIGIFQVSLSSVLGYIAPALYLLLAIIGAALLAGFDPGQHLPAFSTPNARTAIPAAFLFGAFFGLIALPCNPGPLLLLFAVSIGTTDLLDNLCHFVFFGLGMATPLLLISALSSDRNRLFLSFLTRHHQLLNRAVGLFMIVVAAYFFMMTVL